MGFGNFGFVISALGISALSVRLLKLWSFRWDLSPGSFAWFFRWDVSLETSAWMFHWSLARGTFAEIFRGELPLGIECASRNPAALKVDGWFRYFFCNG